MLPNKIVAQTLNAKMRDTSRMKMNEDVIPRMHVSSLIKSSPNDMFCPREFVLKYMERDEAHGGGIAPKFELLWATGHFLGDYIVNKFLKRNKDYAKYAWGDWTCACGTTVRRRKLYNPKKRCRRCKQPVTTYVEVDLFNPAKTVVGHADLIFNVNGLFYVYEFKSIDRADIDFDKLEAPLADHLMQASNYYYMLQSEGKAVSKQIRFVYVDRSMAGLYRGKPFKELEAERVRARRLHIIYDRAREAIDGINSGTLPDRVCSDIGCGRAKNCTKAISCFNRKSDTIKRLPPRDK